MARRNIQMKGKGVQDAAPVKYSTMTWPGLKAVAKGRGVVTSRKSRATIELELRMLDDAAGDEAGS